eukprot:TRINITY_DN64416_c0_g1_i1.p1 TRINITY_DN64416_c0_g1~~TRINITY_DN64416_c0_g1_i1.p1  ORF type:complete len:299 (+),score=13.62 TRINITY_DN64416_c0_g1_i1:96-992(+)
MNQTFSQHAVAAHGCTPWWYHDDYESCPYGRHIPGDVTLPSNPSPMQMVAVFYSVLPYILVVAVGIEIMWRRGTRQMSFLLFTGIITFLNEFIVKRIVSQPRPVGSCNVNCGMPSSHATMSTGYLLLMLFDGFYRIVPSKDELEVGVDERLDCDGLRQFSGLITATPLVPRDILSHTEFTGFFVCWFALLGPVPIMRVKLLDHTVDQVVIGSFIGGVYAVFWFWIATWLSRKYARCLGQRFCFGFFHHNYAPSEFRVLYKSKVLYRGAQIINPSYDDLRGDLDDSHSETTSDGSPSDV